MTISEYILEQDISTATCSDIELERSLAEMNVIAEMCRCYEKAKIFAEYASNSSVVAECGIFLESDGSTDTVEKKNKTFKDLLKSIGKVLKNVLNNFIELLEKLFADSTTKALKKIPDGTIIVPSTLPTYDLVINALIDMKNIEDIVNLLINDIKTNDINDIKRFAEKFDTVKNDINDRNNEKYDNFKNTANIIITKEFMIDRIDDLKKTKKLQKMRTLMNEIKSIENLDNEFYKGNISDIKNATRNVTEYISGTVRLTTYVYNETIKASARRQ